MLVLTYLSTCSTVPTPWGKGLVWFRGQARERGLVRLYLECPFPLLQQIPALHRRVELTVQSWMWRRQHGAQQTLCRKLHVLLDVSLESFGKVCFFISDKEEVGKSANNIKTSTKSSRQEGYCTEAAVPTAETPFHSSEAQQRLSNGSSRGFQQQQRGQLNAKVGCISSFNLIFYPGEWTPKCVWHISISISQSQAFHSRCSSLHLICWQYFPRRRWNHLPTIAQEESSQKALNCALICGDCSLQSQAGAGWCPELWKTRTINVDLHPTSPSRAAYWYSPQPRGNVSCALNHTQTFFTGILRCF